MKIRQQVLLVEPDALLAQHYIAEFKKIGYGVTFVVAAQEALLAINEKSPDIIIVEVILPGHSGIELLYELQSYHDTKDTPVILCTFAQKRDLNFTLKLARQLSVAEYLYKPKTTPKQLVEAVQKTRGVVSL